jgi:hypothetical protein
MYMCQSVAKSNGTGFRCAEYDAQEPGDKGESDIKRPPDSDIPEFDSDHPKGPKGPGAPPFTGGRRRRRPPAQARHTAHHVT